MAIPAQAKPVDIITTEYVRLESPEGVAQIVEPNTVITGVEPDLAILLAGCGKARKATPEEVKAAQTPRAQVAKTAKTAE